MIERVEIDSDEAGFVLVLDTDGDFDVDVERARFSFRLSSDQAVALLREVDEKIRPWHVEGESVRHDHERYKRTGELPDYMRGMGRTLDEAAEILRERAKDRLVVTPVPPTPRRQEGDAHASPSELTEAERREAIRYGRSPLLGEGPPHDIVDDAEIEEEGQAALEAAYDRADLERKREREDR